MSDSHSSSRVVGRGLLRLLADTVVLQNKTQHVRWRAGGALQAGLEGVMRRDYGALAQAGDEIAARITALGVAIPADVATLTAMASIAPDLAPNPIDALASIAQDHRAVVADIETLAVTLPLEEDPQTRALLDTLAQRRQACARRLSALLPQAGDTFH